MNEVQPRPVLTLVGAKSFETSVLCLKSLVDYSAEPVRLVFHEDGSLNELHRERLRAIAPEATFVGRDHSDARVSEMLAKHPHCIAARNSGPLFLKLFDITLLNPNGFSYSDSDIFFLRRYTGVFHPTAGDPPLFFTDVLHAYAVRPWRVWPLGRIRLAGYLNTGIIAGWQGELDLDFLEWLLGRLKMDPSFTSRSYWAEQTCWAALAARTSARLLDPRQFVLASKSMSNVSPETVAIHFVSTFRHHLNSFVSRQCPLTDTSVVSTRRLCRAVTSVGLLWADFRRRVRVV